jgi:predicted nuclease of predicted toxin-antitoxin system
MRVLVDMNLSPQLVKELSSRGIAARHWSSIGPHDAPDRELFDWARNHDYVVLTHDLDFGELLAATAARGPSVIQIRTQDVTPKALGLYLADVLDQFHDDLDRGALLTVDRRRARARVLPIRRS